MTNGAEDGTRFDLKTYFRQLNECMITILRKSGIEDEEVLDAMQKTPREVFVPLSVLYENIFHPRAVIPISPNEGVSLSEPALVARMLEALQVEKGHNVLEVGTGMGYNAAILSRLVGTDGRVVTIEILPEFAEKSANLLQELGCQNVEVVCGNGWDGYADAGPYDRIVVTAAASEMPTTLYKQLKLGGIMVIPIGEPSQPQMLMAIEKGKETPRIKPLGGVVFYPMVKESPSV